jgi:hypothetical protein
MSRARSFLRSPFSTLLLLIVVFVTISMLLTTTACTATETGNPSLTPTFDPASIMLYSDGGPNPADPAPWTVRGAPASIAPAEGDVVAWNLDNRLPEVIDPVRADGSFEVAVEAVVTHHIRLQIVSEERYSTPVTIEVASDVGRAAHIVPDSCLRSLEHTVWVPAVDSLEIELFDFCGNVTDPNAFLRSSGASVPITREGDFLKVSVSDSDLGATGSDLLIVTGQQSDGTLVRTAITLVRE